MTLIQPTRNFPHLVETLGSAMTEQAISRIRPFSRFLWICLDVDDPIPVFTISVRSGSVLAGDAALSALDVMSGRLILAGLSLYLVSDAIFALLGGFHEAVSLFSLPSVIVSIVAA